MAHTERPKVKIVLVVEDDPILLLHNVDMIEEAGFEVVTAPNADAAIAVLEARKDISIVFTDIEMPGTMDGLRLAKAIRDRWPPVHLILASGRFEPHRDEMPEGSKFFTKPFDFGELVETLQTMAAHPRPDA